MISNGISIIMITYGHEKFIREAIEGVLMQQCDYSIELIIADDCSPDNTKAIVESFKSHPNYHWIKYTKHSQNKGMMSNFMWAMDQAQGKYIALCEGDDYWTDPYKLQKQVDFLEANPEYVLCFHPVKVLQPDGQLVDDFITKVPNNYEAQETLAQLGNYIHTPSVVFRNVIKELPLEFEKSPIGDFFLYMLLSDYGKLKCLDEVMCVYRYGVGVWSSKSNYEKNLKTTFTHALIAKCMVYNPFVFKILVNRILQFISKFKNEINPIDLKSLKVIEAIEFEIDKELLSFKNNNKQSLSNFSTQNLLNEVLKRIIKFK